MGQGGEGEEEGMAAAGGPDPESELRRAAAHVDSLISSFYSVRSFPGKWQSIRNKLVRLSSGLAAAAAGVGSPHDNSALSELLRGITSTADEAAGLARGCADESFAGGKLLMRSNLDAVASRFELHVRSLEDIYASGVLTAGRAIVLSKPAAGASRDDVRFYVKDLLCRMRVGGPEVRRHALVALNEILREDDKNVRFGAGETPEFVSVLVGLLEADDLGVQEEAAEAVSLIAGFDSYRPSLVLAGAVAALVRVLETGNGSGKGRAARALEKLTENSDNAWSVSAHGGVTMLLRICGEPCSDGELVGCACGVLRNLAGVGEIKRFMVEQGAVPVFVKLSRSKDEVFAIQAMDFLQAIAGDDVGMRTRVVNEGGIDSLVSVLDPNGSFSSKAREIALRTIETLCFSPASAVSALIAAGFLDRVLFFLRRGETSVQESALKAVARLCAASEEARRAMGEVGFMPELVRLLGAKSGEVREMTAEALLTMLSVQRNQKKFIQEEENVRKIMQLLDPQGENTAATRRFLLSALVAISGSDSGRRKIAACHYVEYLQKLAEANVADAKRVVKRLSWNRLRSILSAILWSSS